MRGVAWLALASLVVAGCSGPAAPAEVVAESGAEPVVGESGKPARLVRTGDLVGVVLDPTYHPVEGALVRLPGMDLQRRTGEDGAFAFIDLIAGPYLLEAEATAHVPASAIVDVQEADVQQVRVVLDHDPMKEPYHVTHPFRGYAEVASDPNLDQWVFGCPECVFRVFLDGPAETVIIEAVRDSDPQPDAPGNRWRVHVEDGTGRHLQSGYGPEPMHLSVDAASLQNATVLTIDVRPTGSPVPETAVGFDVYVTAFHHAPAPDGWSFVGGET